MSRSRRLAKRQQFAHESQGCEGVRDGWIACVSSQTFNFCVNERIVPYPPQNCAKGTICCAATRQCDFIFNCALVGFQIPNATAAVSLSATTIFTPTTADSIETTSPQITHSFTPSSQIATSTESNAAANSPSTPGAPNQSPANTYQPGLPTQTTPEIPSKTDPYVVSEWITTAYSTSFLPGTQSLADPTPTSLATAETEDTDPDTDYSVEPISSTASTSQSSNDDAATTNNTTVPVSDESSSDSSSNTSDSDTQQSFTSTLSNSESSSDSIATSETQAIHTSTTYLPYIPSSSPSISSKSSEAGGKIATPVVGIATPSYHPGQVYIPTQRGAPIVTPKGFEISTFFSDSSCTSTRAMSSFTSTQPADAIPSSATSLLFTAATIPVSTADPSQQHQNTAPQQFSDTSAVVKIGSAVGVIAILAVGVFGAVYWRKWRQNDAKNEADDSACDGSGMPGTNTGTQGQDTSLAAAAMAVALGASQSTSHGFYRNSAGSLKEIDNSAFNTGSVRSRATGISRKSSNVPDFDDFAPPSSAIFSSIKEFTQLMVNATSVRDILKQNQTTGKGLSSNTGSSGLSGGIGPSYAERQVSAESADTQEDYNTRHLSDFSVFTRGPPSKSKTAPMDQAYGESSGIHTWSVINEYGNEDENLAPSDNPPKLSIDTPVSGAASSPLNHEWIDSKVPFSPVRPSPTLSESLNNAFGGIFDRYRHSSKPASKSAATSTSSISISGLATASSGALGSVSAPAYTSTSSQKPVTYLKSLIHRDTRPAPPTPQQCDPNNPSAFNRLTSDETNLELDSNFLQSVSELGGERLESTDSNASDTSNVSRGHVYIPSDYTDLFTPIHGSLAAAAVTVSSAPSIQSHQLRQSILEEDDDDNAAPVGTDYTDLFSPTGNKLPSLLSSQNELSESEIDPRESEKRYTVDDEINMNEGDDSSLRIMVNTFSVLVGADKMTLSQIMDQNGGRGVSSHSDFAGDEAGVEEYVMRFDPDLYELEDEDPDNESIDETDAALQSYDSHVSDASREGFFSPALSEVLVPGWMTRSIIGNMFPALSATKDSGSPSAPPPDSLGDEISPEIKIVTSEPPNLEEPSIEAQKEPSLKSLPSNPSVPDLKIETVPSKPQSVQQPPKSAKSAKNVQAFTGKTEGMHSSQPTHVATEMFFPLRGDEVGLAVGDLLHVMHVHADGWGRAVNLSQGKKQGFVPMSYLRGVKGRIGASKRIVRVVHEEVGDSEPLRKSNVKRDDADEVEDAVKPRPSQTAANNLVWVGALSPSDKRTSLDSIRSNASGRGRLTTRVESLNNA
ncbi:hypothetical protein BJ741DRAFT_593219 [Chytriomyces cf. hyalinus JEL632]|nr:hypothetical protein BJ741DRAFT_593219 [Chytriomyces cf. hyalinus JEL632]